MKQSINRDTRIKPDWMSDCTFIDELQDYQKAFVMSSSAFEIAGKGWFISCDTLSSPIRRGTHDSCIIRSGDTIYWVSDVMENGKTVDTVNCFPVLIKTFTLEEKVNLLWDKYKHEMVAKAIL